MDGLAVVRRARELDEEMGVLLMTAYASVESAIEALRIGAHDYLLKPLILEEVARKVKGLLEHRALVRENARLRRALQGPEAGSTSWPTRRRMKEVVDWVRRAAATRSTVLVTGETGTGKEVVARAIHERGPDRDQPFLAVNLAALPEGMVESELFGHEKGAFTGADRRREGLLRAAGTGTVFLDEIARAAARRAGQAAARPRGHEVQPLGSRRRRAVRGPDRGRHPPRPRGRRPRGAVPRGPLLPPQRPAHPPAAAARAARGHPRPRAAAPRAPRRARGLGGRRS